MGTAAETYIYRMGTAPNTHAVVSQKNKVFGYLTGKKSFQQIGVMSEFGTDESRSVEGVRGIGFGDQVAELVPGNTESMSISVSKTLLYILNLMQSTGYKGGVDGLVRSLKHHRWPFDVKQEMVFSELATLEAQSAAGLEVSGFKKASTQPNGPGFLVSEVRALFTIYEACWYESYAASYSSDAAMVTETASLKVSDIIDGVSTYGEYIDTGLSPTDSSGSGPGQGYSIRFSGGVNPAQVTFLA